MNDDAIVKERHQHVLDEDPPPARRRPFHPSRKHIAIAMQGGGSHAAFVAGALTRLLEEPGLAQQVVGLSGTSGAAHAAAIAWAWLHEGVKAVEAIDPAAVNARAEAMAKAVANAAAGLKSFWDATAVQPHDIFDQGCNHLTRMLAESPFKIEGTPYQFPNSWWADFAQDKMRKALAAALPHGDLPKTEALAAGPQLLIGATEILTGEGRAIKGAEATIEHLLASATLPELFPAHQPRYGNRWDGTYWDGLFSMNPPIAPFMDLAKLPDEIWVVRVNPKSRNDVPKTWVEIADRRNELAGNLSLEQEIAQILRVNELVRRGALQHHKGHRPYKEIKVRELSMFGGQLNRPMTLASKFDRSADFIQNLLQHGHAQADRFLAALPVRVA